MKKVEIKERLVKKGFKVFEQIESKDYAWVSVQDGNGFFRFFHTYAEAWRFMVYVYPCKDFIWRRLEEENAKPGWYYVCVYENDIQITPFMKNWRKSYKKTDYQEISKIKPAIYEFHYQPATYQV